ALVVRYAVDVVPNARGVLYGRAAILARGHLDVTRGLSLVELGDALDVVDLGAVQPQRLGRLALRELQRDDAHADQVRAVDALERLGDDRPHPEQPGALGSPVARRTGAVLLAA